jgi:hypothetical protein
MHTMQQLLAVQADSLARREKSLLGKRHMPFKHPSKLQTILQRSPSFSCAPLSHGSFGEPEGQNKQALLKTKSFDQQKAQFSPITTGSNNVQVKNAFQVF